MVWTASGAAGTPWARSGPARKTTQTAKREIVRKIMGATGRLVWVSQT